MRRRVVLYVSIGSVTLNLALMSTMWVRMREEPKCDVSTRGLAIRLSDPARWVTVQSPVKGSELPPCRANFSQKKQQQTENLPDWPGSPVSERPDMPAASGGLLPM